MTSQGLAPEMPNLKPSDSWSNHVPTSDYATNGASLSPDKHSTTNGNSADVVTTTTQLTTASANTNQSIVLKVASSLQQARETFNVTREIHNKTHETVPIISTFHLSGLSFVTQHVSSSFTPTLRDWSAHPRSGGNASGSRSSSRSASISYSAKEKWPNFSVSSGEPLRTMALTRRPPTRITEQRSTTHKHSNSSIGETKMISDPQSSINSTPLMTRSPDIARSLKNRRETERTSAGTTGYRKTINIISFPNPTEPTGTSIVEASKASSSSVTNASLLPTFARQPFWSDLSRSPLKSWTTPKDETQQTTLLGVPSVSLFSSFTMVTRQILDLAFSSGATSKFIPSSLTQQNFENISSYNLVSSLGEIPIRNSKHSVWTARQSKETLSGIPSQQEDRTRTSQSGLTSLSGLSFSKNPGSESQMSSTAIRPTPSTADSFIYQETRARVTQSTSSVLVTSENKNPQMTSSSYVRLGNNGLVSVHNKGISISTSMTTYVQTTSRVLSPSTPWRPVVLATVTSTQRRSHSSLDLSKATTYSSSLKNSRYSFLKNSGKGKVQLMTSTTVPENKHEQDLTSDISLSSPRSSLVNLKIPEFISWEISRPTKNTSPSSFSVRKVEKSVDVVGSLTTRPREKDDSLSHLKSSNNETWRRQASSLYISSYTYLASTSTKSKEIHTSRDSHIFPTVQNPAMTASNQSSAHVDVPIKPISPSAWYATVAPLTGSTRRSSGSESSEIKKTQSTSLLPSFTENTTAMFSATPQMNTTISLPYLRSSGVETLSAEVLFSSLLRSTAVSYSADTSRRNISHEYAIMDGTMRLVNLEFHSNLHNPNSSMFRTLSADIEAIIVRILALNGMAAERTKVVRFTNGSTVVHFTLYFNPRTNCTSEYLTSVLRMSAKESWKGYDVTNISIIARQVTTPSPHHPGYSDRRTDEESGQTALLVALLVLTGLLLGGMVFFFYRFCKRKNWFRDNQVKPM